MKITLKIKEEVERSYDIPLPYYCKSSTSYYKIIDEQLAIKVEYWSKQFYTLSIVTAEYAVRFSDTPCQAEEFNLAFQQVDSYINHLADIKNENI